MRLHWTWQREREGERVFLLLLFACIERRVRERVRSCSLQFVTHRKKIYWAHCDALRSLFLSLTLFVYYFVVYAWCCFFYLLYSFISYFCLLLSAPLLRCCCCFFFFFYIVTNTQKQLKNNNIKKIPKPKNLLNCCCCCCRGECCVCFCICFTFCLLFSFCWELRILNFDFARNVSFLVLPFRLLVRR